jgi:peptidyl-prolyl cis-trans isomerase B (cyclophilin B)
MMKKYIPVLALLLTLPIYSQAKIDINNLIDRGGLLYAPNKEKPFSGSVFDMYNNGQLIMNGRYRKGLKIGKWTWWNEDGGIDSTGSYKNGLMHRKWTVWRENGKKEGEAHLKNGKLDGLFTAWHENGQTSSEGTYKDGKKEGKWTYWYSNGQKMEEGEYHNGEKYKEWIYYSKDGSKIELICITTDFGVLILELYPNVAPKHVESFIEHVKNGYYNGTTFHRVIPGFMIQGGDPNSKDDDRINDGQGGHSAIYYGLGDENINTTWTIPSEFNDWPHVTGALSMARAQDPNSAGSQFFICDAPAPRLNNQYTVFGQVISGLDVIKHIANASRDNRDNPKKRIEMIIDYCEENIGLNEEKTFSPSKITAKEYFTLAEIEREAKNIKASLENLENLIKHYSEHSLAPQAQYLIGDIYMNDLLDFHNAINSYSKVSENYVGTNYAVEAQFMVGYIYANILSDYEKAMENYLIFLEKYPNHKLAPSVKFEFEFLGKNINEIPVLKHIEG